jgi:hypothetical protein
LGHLLERDEGKQFFRVGFALISGTDEMSIKYKRDQPRNLAKSVTVE